MSTGAKTGSLVVLLRRRLLSPEIDAYFRTSRSYPDADGPNFPELKETYLWLRALYEPLLNSDALAQLPFNAANSPLQAAQNAVNALGAVTADNTSESAFRNFAGALDSFAYQS